ncbi:DUF1176 domain-containing protein [Massilia sp. Dwa41.01b]|uniref:DUF1176 domain-containing protein n=1 Tax=Massilia sp. Dwa41.01b TaxID=2709302 RepID=UPI0022770EF9|nr:DUF1176 domain-containing protein [Massilia sp. Dwa41.01b]
MDGGSPDLAAVRQGCCRGPAEDGRVPGRLGTPGALVRKGSKDERTVLPAVPAPVVVAAKVAPVDQPVDLSASNLASLRKALAASVGDNCPAMAEAGGEPDSVSLQRLSQGTLLASATCWMGAAGTGEAYWTVNERPPFAPRLVSTMGTDYADGKISASGSGGGYDCMHIDEWTWDGKRFIQTEKGTTGMCRGIDMGGGWSLPVLVTDVRRGR